MQSLDVQESGAWIKLRVLSLEQQWGRAGEGAERLERVLPWEFVFYLGFVGNIKSFNQNVQIIVRLTFTKVLFSYSDQRGRNRRPQ